MTIKDVSAATMYDVLHDSQYRKKWDPTMLESFDIARLSANADVGYYSCENISYLFNLITFICAFVSLMWPTINLSVSSAWPDSVSPVANKKCKHWKGNVHAYLEAD